MVDPTATLKVCDVCGFETRFKHDHKSDYSGTDDGPDLDPTFNPPRKKMDPKPPEVMAEIRSRAWATRREKYGECGNRKYGRRLQ